MATHIALLGDSVFDDGSYTQGEPDVVSHLRSLVPRDVRATLYAVDGSTTRDVGRQLDRLARDVNGRGHLPILAPDSLAPIDEITSIDTLGVEPLGNFAP